MRSLVITEGERPNYARPGLGAESGEFYVPPTTHFIATVEDLTDMLDHNSEDIYGMDVDAGDKQSQSPPHTGRWAATSTYDVYMVDTPKEDGDEGSKHPIKDNNTDKPPKRRHERRRSKSRCKKYNNTDTEDNNTPDNAEDQEAPIKPTSEQDDWAEGQVNPDDPIGDEGSEDSNYLLTSEEDESLGDEDFIVPEDPSNKSSSSAG